MKIIIFIIILAAVVTFLYPLYTLRRGIAFSQTIVKTAIAFQLPSTDMSNNLLVLGDSTAVGVGASIAQSVPALLARDIKATYVENKALSGAVVADLEGQRASVTQERYQTILIQIGGNDVVARHDAQKIGDDLKNFLKTLPEHEQLYVLMCGDVGVAPLIPWYLRSYYSRKNQEFHQAFEGAVTEAGGTYVNLFVPRESDPFLQNPKRYFALDAFHPSAEGYALWYQKLHSRIKE